MSDVFTFCTKEDLPFTGFQSLYSIPEEEANKLLEAGSYKGYRGIVNSTTDLWVDFDELEAVEHAIDRLKYLGLAFEVWTTGNRGKHIRIFRSSSSTSEHVPAIDKAWVRANLPGADLSIYTSLHPFRRPGAIHKLTGKEKQIETSHVGNTLQLEETDQSVKRTLTKLNQRSVFEDPQILALSVPYWDGERHRYLLKLAIKLAGTGASEQFIFEWLWNVNILGDPWDEDKIQKIATWAFNEANCNSTVL
jgi:hypothetical protein